MPNAIRLAPGVVNTELAIASDGPAAMPAASCWSVLPLDDGNWAGVGSAAACTASRMPFSEGTLRTGSAGVSEDWLPPPQAATSTARGAASDATTRDISEARLVGACWIRRERLDHRPGVEGLLVALPVDEECGRCH